MCLGCEMGNEIDIHNLIQSYISKINSFLSFYILHRIESIGWVSRNQTLLGLTFFPTGMFYGLCMDEIPILLNNDLLILSSFVY